jgi:hypothetical protein
MNRNIDYYEQVIRCDCGSYNIAECISTYDSILGVTYRGLVAGQACTDCGKEIDANDIY